LSLYRVVLEDPLPWLKIWSGPGAPSVSRSSRVIDRMDGVCRLVAQLLYGSGLRLLEALMLRVKDVDFERDQLTVRDPKWKRDRVTMLPRTVAPALQEQLSEARLRHGEDLARISHTPPAASAANSLSASLRSVALLDVLSSTPSSRSRRAPRIQGRSRRSRGGGV
jgi:integrase